MQFAIHTYGYFDAMFYVLNGIKMIMNSEFAGMLIKLMALIASSYYALLGMAGAAEGKVGYYFLKTAGMITIVVTLLIPKADMLVIDRVSGKKEIVTDLPYAFVLPVGALEAFGAGVTSIFEQAFAPVSSIPFKDYGMLFGHRIVQESKNWKIANPEFSSNMDSFIKRCVVLEAMIGHRFTPEVVYSSADVFSLVTENAGTFRKIPLRINGAEQRATCKEAGGYFKNYMKSEVDKLAGKYINSDFGLAGNGSRGGQNAAINKILKRNIEIGYSSTLGIDASAEDIIRQNMMINSIKEFNSKSDLYGYSRAKQEQNSNWFISAELAKEYLPLLLNIMKALVYASFVFIVPLMLISGGVDKYLKYGMLVFSLQIWPALNSVLNLFIELYSHSKAASLGGVITLGNYNQAHQSVETIVLVAGMLQASIPFLSFAIVQGGVGGFVHLAGQISGASAGAASAASHQLATGAREADNVNIGNQSMHNKNGYKTDLNRSYMEGATQIQGADGSIHKSFADGSSSISSGSGINLSSGSRSFVMEDSQQTSLQEGLSNSLSGMKAAEQGYSDAETQVMSNTADLVSHIAQRESAGQSFNYDEMGEQGRALQQAVNHTKDLVEHQGYKWEQAAGSSVKAHASAGFGSPSWLPFKVDSGIGTEGNVSASNNSDQGLSEDNRVVTSNDTNKSFNNLVKAGKNEQWMKDNSIDTSYAENIRASHDRMQSYHKSASVKREEADTYHKALNAVSSSGSTDRQEMYHALEENVMNRYGLDQSSAHQMIEKGDARVDKVWGEMVASKNRTLLSEIGSGKSGIENTAKNDANEFQNNYSGQVNNQLLGTVKNQANKQGLDQEQIQQNIAGKGSALETHGKKIITENVLKRDLTKDNSNVINQTMQSRANQYEKDRIGQGNFVAPLVGTAANIISLGNGGSNIGGPNAKQKSQINLATAKANQIRLNTLKE